MLLMVIVIVMMMMIRILCLYFLRSLLHSLTQPLSVLVYDRTTNMSNQQMEHDAIKLLFIFVFISFQHHTSFSVSPMVAEEMVCCFRVYSFTLSHFRSLPVSLIRLLFSFHFCCFSFVSKSHFSFIYKTIHQNSIKSVV